MSQEIRIDYEAVYTKTAELRQRLQSELKEMENGYRQIVSKLHGMDRPNAEIIKTIEAHRRKAQAIFEAITRLLSFMDASARQVEKDEFAKKEHVQCPKKLK